MCQSIELVLVLYLLVLDTGTANLYQMAYHNMTWITFTKHILEHIQPNVPCKWVRMKILFLCTPYLWNRWHYPVNKGWKLQTCQLTNMETIYPAITLETDQRMTGMSETKSNTQKCGRQLILWRNTANCTALANNMQLVYQNENGTKGHIIPDKMWISCWVLSICYLD